jgi:hypothetical protein
MASFAVPETGGLVATNLSVGHLAMPVPFPALVSSILARRGLPVGG